MNGSAVINKLSELILILSVLKIKWLMFGYIHLIMSWTLNLYVKINEAKSTLLQNN